MKRIQSLILFVAAVGRAQVAEVKWHAAGNDGRR